MKKNKLPLQELFTKLREAGLPLGIDEYQLVLQSLQAGFGIADKAALKRLCQVLWVKSAEEKSILDYHFEQVMSSEAFVSQQHTNTNTIVPTQVVSTPETNGNIIVSNPGKNANIIVSIPKTNINNIVQAEEKLVKQSSNRKSYRIANYLIPGFLGIGIVLMIGLSQQRQTPKPKPIQTPTASNQEKNQSNLIAWIFLSFTNLGAGYLIFRYITKRNFQKRNDHKTYVPKGLTPSYPTAPALTTEEIRTQEAVLNNALIEEATPNFSTSPVNSELIQPREDEVQVVKSVLQNTWKDEEISDTSFILNKEFFPVTQRQMKQIWRYLRRPVREGKPTELDLKATISHIANQGILLNPVLIPAKKNRAELLLLIDQDGSMVPFHGLSHRLAETALRGGRLGRTGIYYFHNCPVEYLYRDNYHQQGELVNDIITYVCSRRTAVLIFSDAGAARGGYSKERYQLTQEFLTRLQQRVDYIAWLNPMPKKRWFDTAAGEISSLVPMFEVSKPGLQDAISLLRGRPTNFEGRRK